MESCMYSCDRAAPFWFSSEKCDRVGSYSLTCGHPGAYGAAHPEALLLDGQGWRAACTASALTQCPIWSTPFGVLTALLPRKHLADHDRAVRQDRDARGDIVYPVDAVVETSEPTTIWDYEPGGAAPWPAICRIVSMGDRKGTMAGAVTMSTCKRVQGFWMTGLGC